LIAEQLRAKRRGQAGQSWYVDATSVKVNGKWCYLYRASDRDGNLVDSLLSEKRDMEAARRFDLRKLSMSLGTLQHGGQPMGMLPTHVPSGRSLAWMFCTEPTSISTIDWSKIIVASNSATPPCAGSEAWHQPPAFAVRSMKYASSFGSLLA
jgi:hypothetical protein